MSGSILRDALLSGRFALTADVTPPRGTALQMLESQVAALAGRVHAINVTENPGASVRMCSLAGSVAVMRWGAEPVMQVVCRGRNRLALQSDLLGAAALGVRNLLCLTGDEVSLGGHPSSANLLDLDAVGLLHAAHVMRTKGRLTDGEEIQGPCDFFLGAAADPFLCEESEFERLRNKLSAGADFLQTQPVFDLAGFRAWLEGLSRRGMLGRVRILAGILPLRGEGSARYLSSHVPGINIPERLIQRLADSSAKAAEGIDIAIDLARELVSLPGVDGLHIMAGGWAEAAALIADALELSL